MSLQNLFVAKLPRNVTDADLQHIFDGFEPTSAKVMLDAATGKSKGFGFVLFPSEEAGRVAYEALNKKHLTMNGHSFCLYIFPSKHDGKVGMEKSNALYIRNIPRSLTRQQVEASLRTFGSLTYCAMREDHYGGPVWVVYAEYETEEIATHAMETLHGNKSFFNFPVAVLAKYADSEETKRERRRRREAAGVAQRRGSFHHVGGAHLHAQQHHHHQHTHHQHYHTHQQQQQHMGGCAALPHAYAMPQPCPPHHATPAPPPPPLHEEQVNGVSGNRSSSMHAHASQHPYATTTPPQYALASPVPPTGTCTSAPPPPPPHATAPMCGVSDATSLPSSLSCGCGCGGAHASSPSSPSSVSTLPPPPPMSTNVQQQQQQLLTVQQQQQQPQQHGMYNATGMCCCNNNNNNNNNMLHVSPPPSLSSSSSSQCYVGACGSRNASGCCPASMDAHTAYVASPAPASMPGATVGGGGMPMYNMPPPQQHTPGYAHYGNYAYNNDASGPCGASQHAVMAMMPLLPPPPLDHGGYDGSTMPFQPMGSGGSCGGIATPNAPFLGASSSSQLSPQASVQSSSLGCHTTSSPSASFCLPPHDTSAPQQPSAPAHWQQQQQQQQGQRVCAATSMCGSPSEMTSSALLTSGCCGHTYRHNPYAPITPETSPTQSSTPSSPLESSMFVSSPNVTLHFGGRHYHYGHYKTTSQSFAHDVHHSACGVHNSGTCTCGASGASSGGGDVCQDGGDRVMADTAVAAKGDDDAAAAATTTTTTTTATTVDTTTTSSPTHPVCTMTAGADALATVTVV